MQVHPSQIDGVPLVARLASGLVLGYFRHCPIKSGKGRLVRMANRFLVVRLADNVYMRIPGLSHVELAIARDGVFEGETVELFRRLLAPGMTGFDVGANVGLYTLLASKRVGPCGQVHAFEPADHVAAKLLSSVRLNRFNNAIVNRTAASDCNS
jgi:hypothetical protein